MSKYTMSISNHFFQVNLDFPTPSIPRLGVQAFDGQVTGSDGISHSGVNTGQRKDKDIKKG